MASWSTKRRLSYALIFTIVIILTVVVPIFKFFYKAPTCFDNKKNGDETDVDCGGSCRKLCQSAFLPPRIEWGGAKFEKLANGLYNASSYIVNPNINGGAINVPYKISLYDAEGVLITERIGTVNLYPHRNSLAFQTAINVNKSIPVKATFEFTNAPQWFRAEDKLTGVSVIDKKYEENENSSSLQVTIENNTLYSFDNIQVSAVLYDSSGNVIGFSQTKLDSIPKGGREIAPFTWSDSRSNRVVTQEILLNIIPISNR